jgi:hypothetical protein
MQGIPALPTATFGATSGRNSPQLPYFELAAAQEIQASASRKPRHYMLVIDRKLDPAGSKDIDAAWTVVKGALGEALPGLQLVRLTGGLEEMKNEYPLVPHVRAACNRS